MAKRNHDNQPRNPPQQYYPPPGRGVDTIAILTLVGVIAVVTISFSNWREIDRIQEGLDGRLGKIETQIAQMSTKVDNIPAQAAQQPPQRGPDPNRVYQIKTAGAPVKGSPSAPITVAEFSDFQ